MQSEDTSAASLTCAQTAAPLRKPRWTAFALNWLPMRQRLRDWAQRWAMLAVVLTLLAWLWIGFFWFSAHQKRQLVIDRGAELALMASAVAQHSAGLLRSVSNDLRALDVWLVTHPGAEPLTDPRFLALVDEMRQSSNGMMDLRMVSSDGQLFYLPSADGKPLADVSDREYFLFHATGAVGGVEQVHQVHISAPVRSRVTRRWDIPVSLRLTAPVRGPATASGGRASMQVLFAAVALDQFAGKHEHMRFQPDGAISLVRSDGIVLSRAPLVEPYIGRDFSRSPHFGESWGQSARGSFISEGAMTDGVLRLVSYERLEDFPVTVLVSRGLADIYSTYYGRMQTAIVFGAVLSGIVLAVTITLLRSQRSQNALRLLQDDLHRLATTDELTGVMNRRAFMAAAEREFDRAQRYARPAAVLALDIDHFKQVNDVHGHAGGDVVLRSCAALWQSALREQDLLARLGGEEFCILLPETGEVPALQIAERLRKLTSAAPMLDGRCAVSVSIGWTAIGKADPGHEAVLERADLALYAAKNSGRNCVRPVAAQHPEATDATPWGLIAGSDRA